MALSDRYAVADESKQTGAKLEITSKNISDLRARLGLTQAKFGEQVGVTWMTVHRWESGKTAPKSEASLRKLRELLEEESECNHKN